MIASLLLFWSKFQYSVEKSPRISKFHGFIHNTYFIFSNIYSCKFIFYYNFLCSLGVWIPDTLLGEPGSIPLEPRPFFLFFFFFLDLAKISPKTKVKIQDARTFFQWILKYWPQGFWKTNRKLKKLHGKLYSSNTSQTMFCL